LVLGFDLAGGPLLWRQRDMLGLEHELRSGDQPVGTLRWDWATRIASGEAGGHRWTFRTRGVLHPEVGIGIDGQEDAAIFHRRVMGRGGTLELPGLGLLTYAPAGLLSREWEWSDASGTLVRLANVSGLLRRSGRVDVVERARSLKELPLLVTLAWYVKMQTDMDNVGSGSG
jgi:hypothetical protein